MMGFIKLVLLLAALAVGVALSVQLEEDPHSHARRVRMRWTGLAVGLALVVLVLLLWPAIGYVDAGYRGVVLRFGAVTGRTLDPGIYLVTPVAESVEDMDVQVHADKLTAAASSRDLQDVHTEVTLNYNVDPARAGEVYTNLRKDYIQRVVDPAIQEAVKATTARFDAEELITKRPEVRDSIDTFLTNRLGSYGIHVDGVFITDFQFSPDFSAAIEKKVTAVQKALQAENDLRRIKTEAEQRVAEAMGQAKAIQLQAQSIAAQGGEAYLQLRWIERWDGHLPATLAAGQGTTPLLMLGPK
jgi:regulator of protease activity HflC (stomatin/prohibitin superfamily)